MNGTKQCCICGCEFKPYHKRQVTCGSAECKRLQHLDYMKRYNKATSIKHREYNREWMRRARRARGDDLVRDYSADSYAERQKRKTLAMIGGVDLGQKL